MLVIAPGADSFSSRHLPGVQCPHSTPPTPLASPRERLGGRSHPINRATDVDQLAPERCPPRAWDDSRRLIAIIPSGASQHPPAVGQRETVK